MKTRKRTAGIAGICLCLLIATFYGAFALYTGNVDGNAKTSIAAFAFDATVNAAEKTSVATTSEGEKEIGEISVTNQDGETVGEVTTQYSICLMCSEPLPETVTLALNRDGTEYIPSEINEDRNEFIFTSDKYMFSVDTAQTNTYTVLVQWKDHALPAGTDLAITAKIIGEQVD